MSYQVLALKWRPRLFKDAVGQDAIAKTLKNSIKNQKMAHSYLLTGTRGIGKTTFARIFAKAIRCENRQEDGEPCLKCNSCEAIDQGQSLDLIEIDGASNNSVDDIRELIENVQYLPTQGQYKVYIIDEVHMLSVSAFNALLKTLEEPPKHVVFIFATTDPHKLLGTVLSRCIRFDFKNATLLDLEKHLKKIASAEGLTFESDFVVSELAKQSAGSFRDALSLFDQVISLSDGNLITEEALNLSLGLANSTLVNAFIRGIFLKDKEAVVKLYQNVLEDNIDFKIFSRQVLQKIGELITNISNEYQLETSEENILIIKGMNLVELMWIYESMYKDLEWSFNTFEPEKATLFAFVKQTQRDIILQKAEIEIELKKKQLTSTEFKKVEPEQKKSQEMSKTPVTPEIKMEPIVVEETIIEEEEESSLVDVSWENFLKFVFQVNRALAINLEHGNMINQEDFGSSDCVYEIGFSEDSKIFYDFLIELDNSYKLKELICTYLEFDISQVEINLRLIKDKENEKFLSNAQIVAQNVQDAEVHQKEKLLNNKYIKSAQELFNSEIGQVVLNKNGE